MDDATKTGSFLNFSSALSWVNDRRRRGRHPVSQTGKGDVGVRTGVLCDGRQRPDCARGRERRIPGDL